MIQNGEARPLTAISCLLEANKFGPREVLAFIIVGLSFAFVAFHLYAGMLATLGRSCGLQILGQPLASVALKESL